MKNSGVLDNTFFSANRKRLRELFGGTAPIIIAGNSLLQKSADSAYSFAQDSNFWYLTGLNESGLILVMESDKEYIIAPAYDVTRATFDGALDFSELSGISAVAQVYDQVEGWQHLSRRLKKVKHAAIIQPSPAYIQSLTMFTNPSRAQLFSRIKEENETLDFIDLRSVLASMRSVKSEREIDLHRDASRATGKMFKLLEKKRNTSEFEYELMAEISKEAIRTQQGFAYDPVIASGKNALTLHYTANNAPIDKSKFLLLDIGLKAGQYGADITRSVVSNPSKRQCQVYEAVLSVQEFAITVLKPGTSLVIYEEAIYHYMGEKLRELGLIKTISKETVRTFYPHATSHFLGIDVHDVGDHDAPLVPGMVLTVEPGIYIKDESLGIRIEDMVVITESGNDNISAHIPKLAHSLV